MLLKHTAVYMVVRAIAGAINFLTLLILARLLTPDEYGQYALVLAVVALIQTFAFQWLRESLLRFLPLSMVNRSALLSTTLLVYLALAIIITFGASATILFSYFHQRDPVYSLFSIILGTAILLGEGWLGLNLELARSNFRPRLYGGLWISKSVLALVVGGGLAYLGFSSSGALLGAAVGAALPTVFTSGPWMRTRLALGDKSVAKSLFSYGLPLSAHLALGQVILSSDRLFLRHYEDLSSVGIYALGYDLTWQSILMLTMAVNTAALPLAFRKMETGGLHAAQVQLKQNLNVLLAVALPLVVGISLIASNFAYVFVSQDYASGVAAIIPWVAISVLLFSVKIGYADLAFQLTKSTLGQVWVTSSAALINIILNVLMIPPFGIMGAAYSTAIAYAVSLLLSLFLGTKLFPLPKPDTGTIRIVLSTAGMAACLIPIYPFVGIKWLALQVSLAAAVYCGLLLAQNVLSSRTLIARVIRTKRQSW